MKTALVLLLIVTAFCVAQFTWDSMFDGADSQPVAASWAGPDPDGWSWNGE